MASQKLTDLAAISTPATADVLYIIDSSDTSDNASGSSRRITFGSLIESSTITLTNKTLTSPTINSPVLSSIQVQDTSADHQYVFAVSELVADRIVTLPLLTGNDEFVFKDFTQTLTNKTLTSPVFDTNADLNGVELILDADADSSLTADTDDRFDFKLGGSDRFRVGTSDFDIVTATGNIQVAGADPKRGIYVPSSAMYGATTSGAASGQYESATNKVNVKVLDFDTSADEYACFNIPAPDYWDLSTITVQFHWTAASGSGTVCFGLAGLARSDDDALDTAYGTVQTATDTLITALDEHISPATSAITVGGTPAKGDMLYLRILRDVSEDTLGVDARLLGVRIKFGISQYDDS